MTDEQMKADLDVLAEEITFNRDMGQNLDADAFQRIHDALSARLADAVQPAAGEGGLREALEPLAKLSSGAEWDDVPDNARADVVYRSEAGGEESVGTISFGDFRRARAALSTSVPAGVVWGVYLNDGRFMDIASDDKQTAIDMAEAHYETADYVVRPLYPAAIPAEEPMP